MTNIELQQLLSAYPGDMPVRMNRNWSGRAEQDLDNECIDVHSVTAYIDDEAPEEEWDTESGKFMLGNGLQYLLINPIIP